MVGHQDWVGGLVYKQAVPPANRTATFTSAAIDTQLTDGQLGLILSGTVNAGTVAVSFTESDTSGGTYTAVALADTATLTTDFAAAARAFNVFPTKQFLKVVLTGASSPDFTLAGELVGRQKFVGQDPRL